MDDHGKPDEEIDRIGVTRSEQCDGERQEDRRFEHLEGDNPEKRRSTLTADRHNQINIQDKMLTARDSGHVSARAMFTVKDRAGESGNCSHNVRCGRRRRRGERF